jgi:transposase InsO family protein
MRRIDMLSLAHPFAGSRMLRDMLNREGFDVGRRHVSTLMRRMGIEALYRKPNTSKKHPTHKVYPYLLRELKIDRANQVWASDISAPWRRGLQRRERSNERQQTKLAGYRPAVAILGRVPAHGVSPQPGRG